MVVFVVIRVARSYPTAALLLARHSNHMSFLRVMWFVLVYSYVTLKFTSISLLWCVQLGHRTVLSLDGSVQCFSSKHLPYALLAIAILVVIIIPAPLILLCPRTRRHIQFKGLVDEASRLYRHKRCWWAGVNLLRRIAVTALGLTWHDELQKLWVLTAYLLLLYLAHDVIR